MAHEPSSQLSNFHTCSGSIWIMCEQRDRNVMAENCFYTMRISTFGTSRCAAAAAEIPPIFIDYYDVMESTKRWSYHYPISMSLRWSSVLMFSLAVWLIVELLLASVSAWIGFRALLQRVHACNCTHVRAADAARALRVRWTTLTVTSSIRFRRQPMENTTSSLVVRKNKFCSRLILKVHITPLILYVRIL